MLAVVAAVLFAAAPQSPTAVVKAGNDAVQKVLGSKDATVTKLEETVDQFVDFGELAKRALGKEWDKLSAAQRADFSATMKGLLRASYAQKALGQADAKVSYGKETVKGEDAEVETTIKVKKDNFPVVYRLYKKDAKAPWKIYDVVTDEVSLVETYRDMFRKVIAQKGFDGLLKTLKDKRDQLEKQAKEAPPAAAGASAR